MWKKLFPMFLALCLLAALPACAAKTNTTELAAAKLKVAASFDAMKELVQAVGGDRVEVTTIIPDGTEPHEFEPKAGDLVALKTAAVLVVNGLGMEAWKDNAVQAAGNENLIVVEAAKGVNPIQNTDQGEIEEHGQYDPHLWLSLKAAETAVGNIAGALAQADPEDKDFYEKNRGDFAKRLEQLYGEYSTKFANAPRKSIVTGHAAFAYLCRDFGLQQNSVEDVFAEGEPSAQKLAELTEYCKANKVKTVFVEDMVSPAVSQTLANEVGATAKKIYTIESGEDGKSYLERMRENLNEIWESLKD